jgi:hypothetical protein
VKIANRQVPVVLIGVWVLCLVGLVAAHLDLVAPQERAVAASRAEIEAAAEWFTSLKNARSTAEQERLATEREETERRFASYVFTAEQLNQLDFELRALSEQHHLTDFSARHVRTTNKVGAAEFKRIAQRDMILSFKSTFPDFLRFINELERHYPVLLVDSFTPAAAPDKGGVLSCTMECSLLYETKID